MTISSKGRYALHVLIDLAEHDNSSYIPMKIVAERQGLPLKYLEHTDGYLDGITLKDLMLNGSSNLSDIDVSFLDAAL